MNDTKTCSVNCKRLALTIVAVSIFIIATDFLVHGLLLDGAYKATASIWRPEAEMPQFMPWMFAGQLLGAIFLCLIFVKGYEGKGIMEGVRFGLLIGPFSLAHTFIQYSVSPIPCSLFCAWIATMMAQAVGAGILCSLIYKK